MPLIWNSQFENLRIIKFPSVPPKGKIYSIFIFFKLLKKKFSHVVTHRFAAFSVSHYKLTFQLKSEMLKVPFMLKIKKNRVLDTPTHKFLKKSVLDWLLEDHESTCIETVVRRAYINSVNPITRKAKTAKFKVRATPGITLLRNKPIFAIFSWI